MAIKKGQKRGFDYSETLAMLKRSNEKSLLVVEGREDDFIFRHLENYGDLSFITQEVGGRNNVFKLEKELRGKSNIRFLADKDFFWFNKGFNDYPGIIFTFGFSIENDILSEEKMTELLLNKENKEFYNTGKISLVHWLSYQLYKLDNSRQVDAKSAFQLLEAETGQLKEKLPDNISNEKVKLIEQNFGVCMRGKTLLSFFCMASKINSVNYTESQLVDIAVKQKHNNKFKELVDRINFSFSSNLPT